MIFVANIMKTDSSVPNVMNIVIMKKIFARTAELI